MYSVIRKRMPLAYCFWATVRSLDHGRLSHLLPEDKEQERVGSVYLKRSPLVLRTALLKQQPGNHPLAMRTALESTTGPLNIYSNTCVLQLPIFNPSCLQLLKSGLGTDGAASV